MHDINNYVCKQWFYIIQYLQIISKGNIITGDILFMKSRQKTFSLALSRDMIPMARLLVYGLVQGEILSDSFTFHVKGIKSDGVNVSTNSVA